MKFWWSKRDKDAERAKALDYLESQRLRFKDDSRLERYDNIVVGAMQAIEDGEDPERASRKVQKYLSKNADLIQKGAIRTFDNVPYSKIRPIQEEVSQRQRYRSQNAKKRKAQSLYAQWAKEARPTLVNALKTNPQVLEKVHYYLPNKEQGGGSFFDFDSSAYYAARRKDGKFIFERYSGGKSMGLSESDDNRGKGYSIDEVVEKVADGLLTQSKRWHDRNYMIKEVKSLTGIELSKLAKRKGLENTPGLAVLLGSIFGILFLSPNITGNTISNMTSSTTNLISAACFLIALVAAVKYFRD